MRRRRRDRRHRGPGHDQHARAAQHPANRNTATALALSAQFLGSAFAPALLPIYQQSVVAACVIAAVVAGIGALVVLVRT
ncbi:hypothetical protein [Mobilicoccus caccae]|uniref:MFS transporter n=1 Tax=Mobilicoccus caccae TaxID=1859295 RepID=A0ABQ6IWL6_9MICO|nr:hypothetical protein [Mobilicoccus caccae]GMA42353.1 hypothetical protein GCM10025883_43980 [Mobilicoccus caccae]